MTDSSYDAIVVGSGAAGSFAARELTQNGLRVLMLEAGRELSDADFDPAKKPAKPATINILERAIATFEGQPIQSRSVFFRGMLRHLYANDRDNPYTTPKDAPFIWIRGRQQGGRLHLFGRALSRWGDDDFKSQSRAGRGVDWPISYDDIAPYYDEVERCLEVSGNADGVETVPDGVFSSPAKLSPAEERFKTAVEDQWPEKHVIAWRSIKPPKSRMMPPLEEALETGLLTVRYDAVARRVLSEASRATGVEFTDTRTGRTEVVNAAHVVLGASPIESVRLLLNSKSGEHPAGLGNSSGMLGRYFMDQLPMLGMGRYDAARNTDMTPADWSDRFYDPAGGVFITRSDAKGDPAARGEFVFQGSIGRDGKAANETADLLFFGFGQMQPDAENRITLDRKKTDKWGIPVPHIRCKMGSEDRRMLARQEAYFLETANGAGGEVEFLGSPLGIREWGRGVYPGSKPIARFLFKTMFSRVMQMGAAIHECGGARMGSSPENSVVNEWGQCWDIPNLYVTDASIFAGSGVMGTTLTVMAQSLRACRHLAAEYSLPRTATQTATQRKTV
ncbi:GMC oxidoreductase [Marinobacterium rhizophilum]|uniref:GMC oxidoreductase n=1 Tax=Marinobacterium rhizophilum TaxID=420402 RepID=UPI00037C969B|nr:GMC family oxidoreductase [Marinobacterium rhizophilum]